jgi:hypothetical protein
MADLDTHTLFGEEIKKELVRWPARHGAYPQLIERTLFGEISLWRTVPWPAVHGST